jgi:putative zinc finger protein
MPESKSTIRQRKLRIEILKKLGGRCNDPNCRWQNDDGTRGCTDCRALQIDHTDGGGSAELRAGHGVGLAHLYRVRDDLKWSALAGIPSRYQLLCANCNWIKRHEAKEARGSDQHKQPARLRRELQTKGGPPRRVRKKA